MGNFYKKVWAARSLLTLIMLLFVSVFLTHCNTETATETDSETQDTQNNQNNQNNTGNAQIDQLIQEYVDLNKAHIPSSSEFVSQATYVNPGNFTFQEVKSQSTDPVYDWAMFFIASHLQNIRSRIGKAMTVNSGYRNPVHNQRIGGAAESQHIYGKAADIHIGDFNSDGNSDDSDKRILEDQATYESAYILNEYPTWVHMDWRYQNYW